MQSFLEIEKDGNLLIIEFCDRIASRGAAIAGLKQAKDIKITAYDIDDKGRRWDKNV
jgi:hypothetical protein